MCAARAVMGVRSYVEPALSGKEGSLRRLNMQGFDSIDILGLAQFRTQVIFGVVRHVLTCSALVLNLSQNVAQFGAQDF